MSWSTAIEEGRIGIVDGLVEGESAILLSRRKWLVFGLVAREELRRLGNGMVTRHPDEMDSVADGRIDEGRHKAKDTCAGSNDDRVVCGRAARTGVGWRRVGGGRRAVGCNAFCVSRSQQNYQNITNTAAHGCTLFRSRR